MSSSTASTGAAAVVDLDAVDVALRAAQVDGPHGEEVDADLEPEADDAAPVELHRQRGAADGAEHLHLGLAHEARLEQLADQARDRRLVEPGALRDRRPGAGPVLGDVPEDHAQVVPADGALVRWNAAGVVGLHERTLTRTAAPRSMSYRSVEGVGERDLGRGERRVGRDELERLRAGEPVTARERAIGHQRVDVGGDVEAERRLVRLLARPAPAVRGTSPCPRGPCSRATSTRGPRARRPRAASGRSGPGPGCAGSGSSSR